MGNKPAKQEREEVMVKVMPPVDQAFIRWLGKDLDRLHGFVVNGQPAIQPPEHYVEYMRHQGWLDLNLDDPDLAHLLKK